MANFFSVLEKIDSLKRDLDLIKPSKDEDKQRLWKKFRLEWNYNSNHIEGNTLTYGQTELLLIFDKTTGDHDMREYEEMKAHDVAIKLIQEYALDASRSLTESDIRELNKIILVRPYWGEAQTSDGQQTRKLIEPGKYKQTPNSVRLQNGEMFQYASPEETPAKMAELMEWYVRAETDKKLHPLQLAAKLHYDFVSIHPFDDSNGRTSRLLMNYVLLRHGFPPVIIKSADKRNYLNALNKADVGDLDSFIEYIGEQLIWSLTLSIKAGNGVNIDEAEDLYKEIAVWSRELSIKPNRAIKSARNIKDIFDRSLKKLIEEYLNKQKDKFENNFISNDVTLEIDDQNRAIGYINLSDLDGIIMEYEKNPQKIRIDGINKWRIICSRNTLKDADVENVYISSVLKINFKPMKYEVLHNENLLTDKPYTEQISNDEIQHIVWLCIKETFEDIKMKSLPRNL